MTFLEFLQDITAPFTPKPNVTEIFRELKALHEENLCNKKFCPYCENERNDQ